MLGIELFSGSGGMGLGAKQAGIDVCIAVEKDLNAAQTYLANHPSTTVVIDDIENVTDFIIDRNNEQLVLFGGPPCQGFSNSNRKTRSAKNPKNWLFLEFIRVIKKVAPDWILIENVPGLQKMDKGFFLERICNDLHQIGYTPNVQILNAADFGVPQKRDRIFIVGSRDGIAFEFPKKHAEIKQTSVKEAISDLPYLKNGDKKELLPYKSPPISEYSKLMRGNKKKSPQNYVTKNSSNVIARYEHIKQGQNWKSVPEKLMNNYSDHTRCHSNIYRRLIDDKPAPVIANYRKSMLIHPTENRGLSLREAARLQSFPDSYIFHGPLASQQQQVGNAVPPWLAKTIFDSIINAS